jgi:hypothetical protein
MELCLYHPNPRKQGKRYSPLKEFKASDCQHRRGEFKHWEWDDSQACYAQFVDLLRQCNLLGVSTAIDLKAFNRLVPSIKRMRHTGYWPAYFLAFQLQAETVVEAADRAVGLPPEDRIAFIFDETSEYEGRAYELWRTLRQSDMAWIRRLGPITFDKSHYFPGLQAADLLAYEVQRNIREVVWADSPGPGRWQFQALKANGHLNLSYIEEEGLEMYMDVIKAQFILSVSAAQRARLDETELDCLPQSIREQVMRERESLGPDA